jgi:hypothetical protein
MSKVLWIIIIIIVVIAGYFLITGDGEESAPLTTAEGTVTNVNLEEVTSDGPALVTIQTEAGETAVIAVPSMGLPLCVAFGEIADVYLLAEGDEVAVAGELDEEGRIVPCADTAHYLRVVATTTLEA